MSFLHSHNKWNYDIFYPKKDGTFRIIKAGNWWINQNTPVGEDAELWEVKPYGGKKLLDIHKMVEPTSYAETSITPQNNFSTYV